VHAFAQDAAKVVNGVNNVTLYGGEWWGYTYSATPTPNPEPSTLFLVATVDCVVCASILTSVQSWVVAVLMFGK
jgi:hypothetical protein